MKQKYSVGSLFAGIGGICLALRQSGANILWANEVDKYASKTFRENFSGTSFFEEDIRNLDTERIKFLGETNILTAGFPCQPFSIAGNRLGFKDSRGSLFFEIIRIIKELQPMVILFENVKTIKTHDNKKTFWTIENEIRNIGYSFQYDILNTYTHTELPQNRERIFIVSFRNDLKEHINFEFPKQLQKEHKSIAQLINRRKKVEKRYYYTEESQYYSMFKQKIKNYNSIYNLRRVYVREIQNGLCPTLTANMGLGGHNVPLVRDRWGIRKFTPRECANFQGFPQTFVLPKDISNQQLYKQIGNSVTVPLVKRIAENIIEALNNIENRAVKRKYFSDSEEKCNVALASI